MPDRFRSATSNENDCIPPINKPFEENVRPIIDLVDNLRELGLENDDISLPSIVVVGDQSSGKSSVLEAISGIQLPRGTGITTRCPLELKLRHSNNSSWSAKIRYKTLEGEELEKVIHHANDVGGEVRNSQSDLTRDEKDISNQLISLSVVSYDIPDLSIIDLPGIARLPAKGQPLDIYTKIKNIIKRYVEKECTILLCVIPSNQDIATNESLNIAKEVDPHGERTLGVLTKPDLIDKGAEKDVLNLIKNEGYHLKKGYSIIKCRSQVDIDNNLSVAESRQSEHDFFINSEIFKHLYENGMAGIDNLTEKLSNELVFHIKSNIPNMFHQLEAEKINSQMKFDELGEGPPQNDSEKQNLLFKIGNSIVRFFESVSKAEYRKSLPEEHRLYSIFYGKIEKLNEIVESHHKDYNNLEKIGLELKSQRGVELPGFLPYNVCKYFISDFLDNITDDIISAVVDICFDVLNTISYIVEMFTSNYPDLKNAYLIKVKNLHFEMQKTCKEALKAILHQQYFPFSIDKTYNKMFARGDKDLEIASQNERNDRFCRPHLYKEKVENINLFQRQQMDSLICEPYHCMKCLKENSEGRIQTKERKMAENVTNYVKLVSSRLVDNIAMTIIFHCFDQFPQKLRIGLQHFATESSTKQLIAEDPSLVRQRTELQSRIERINEGLKLCEQHLM